MNAEAIAAAVRTLAETPATVRDLLVRMSDSELRIKPGAGLFSPLEDAWHLRDIEVEGYLRRIKQVLRGDLPVFVHLDGDRLALERRYEERELAKALAEFTVARAESVYLLDSLALAAWGRRAIFGQQVITLGDLVATMIDHDRGHVAGLRGIQAKSMAA